MHRFLTTEVAKHVGEKVKVAGWANVVRRHGKIVFIDLRDRGGVLQCVFTPQIKEIYDKVQEVRPEWVVEITGQIVKRPESMVNPKIKTGAVEMSVDGFNVLAKAETLPFSIETDGREIGEEIRMKYRYLDLRRERLKNNLVMRHKAAKFVRDFLTEEGFIEVETPTLTKSTPEGARDFVVPSRLHPGKFYALPQSPQQYKQLFMAAGIEKYFQLAKCLRDEDPRGDRQTEHTQIDIEMSFVEREDILDLIERMFIKMVEVLYPEKKIQQIPFPRIPYRQAMEKYNSDKPDLREDKSDPNLLAFCWIIDFPFFEETDSSPTNFEYSSKERGGRSIEPNSKLAGDKGRWTFVHNPFSAPRPEFMDDLMNKKNIENIVANQYDIVLNGFELASGGIRNHKPETLEKVFEIMGYEKEEIKEKFGHMLDAFSFGTPPHGGIAPGLDRLIMILQNEPNIREVIAFPKTGDGRDLMMNAPSEISKNQLKDLHIKISAARSKSVKNKKSDADKQGKTK